MNVEKLLFSGINADYYEYENGNVIKLFKKNQKSEISLEEYKKALDLCKKTTLAPLALEMNKSLGREGIVFKMITGNTALDLAINAKDPIYCANVLYEVIEKINAIKGIKLESYKDVLKVSIQKAYEAHEVSKDVYECALNLLKGFKDGGIVCNSMLEPNNIIVNKGVTLVPEWDKVCLGVKEYELARTYIHLMIRKYPEKGYNEKSIKEFLTYVYQALEKSTGITIENIKDYIYVVCVAMLGEYVEYGSDEALKEFIKNGEF